MADLTSGRYANQSPNWGFLGGLNNLTQSDIPAFSSLPPLPMDAGITDAKCLITKEEVTFPVYLPWGTVVKQISLNCGAEATETLTHAFFVVRSAPKLAVGGEFKPVLQAESGDLTTLEGKATEIATMSLKTPLLVTPEIAPFGFVYFSIFVEATKAGSWASIETPATALNKAVSSLKVFPLYENGPIYSKSKPASATVPEKEPKEVVYVVKIPFVIVQ